MIGESVSKHTARCFTHNALMCMTKWTGETFASKAFSKTPISKL